MLLSALGNIKYFVHFVFESKNNKYIYLKLCTISHCHGLNS